MPPSIAGGALLLPLFDRSPRMEQVLRLAAKLARTELPILLLGEPGTGKSSLARALHEMSGRRGSFVICQLAATPDTLHHSELFGHTKGAFSGALASRSGAIESAANGTLFLDELAVASDSLQATLLALFDPGAVHRVGEDRARSVTARIIGASNVDLDALAEAGGFRRDLLDRFGSHRLELPPLRERRDEIMPVFEQVWRREHATADGPTFESDALDLLLEASWPGNLRELENVAAYVATVVEGGEPIALAHYPRHFLREAAATAPLDDARVRDALTKSHGNKSAAARALGVSRRTVQRRTKPGRGAT